METKHSPSKDKPLEFSKIKKTVNTKNGINYWRPPLHQMCLTKASFLVANRIGKAKKPFTIEELILPAAKDICYEFLEEVAVETVAHVPLLASTVTRQTDKTAEDIEAQ